ncbi:MAG: hypothetical protein JOY99_01875 [Sphingomonadaceae bacterium]|nr:hypothetical protein [Sphingomonadaceae bacterium]
MRHKAFLILGGLALIAAAAPASARERIAVFGDWGAFRDSAPVCYAIAEPAEPSTGNYQPFVTVSFWPKRGIARQVHVRLSRIARANARVTLSVGDSTFVLAARGPDAWGNDRLADAYIVAAMRSGSSMSIQSIGPLGEFTDVYRLRGAASAIDAAALDCRGR